MGHRYSLIPSATYIPQSPHEVLVKGGALEGFSLLINDPLRRGLTARIVAELRHSARSAEELSKDLREEIGVDDLKSMLLEMESGGAIERLDDESLPESDGAWTTFVRYGELPDPRLLSELTVAAEIDASPFLQVASSWGIPLRLTNPEDVGLGDIEPVADTPPHSPDAPRQGIVFIGESYARTGLMIFNRDAIRNRLPVFYASIDGSDYTVGPYVVPGKTACMWETERQWARSSADREQYETLLRVRQRGNSDAVSPSREHKHVAAEAFAATLAPALLELSLRGTSSRGGVVLHGRATTSELSNHSVMRLPRCPICMPMQPMARNPLY